MKFAMNNSGELIMAEAGAPSEASCPNCKGIVILRSRRNGYQPNDVTYFWRHENHTNPKCPARFNYDQKNRFERN